MKRSTLLLFAVLIAFTACATDASEEDTQEREQPAPIAYGEDYDPYCDQQITDKRYGAVLILSDGARLTFASTECMIGYEIENNLTSADISERWVVDVVRNKRFLDAIEARFLHSKNQPSPGGLDLSPFEDNEDLSYNMRFLLHGDDLRWNDAVELVRSTWFSSAKQ